MPNRLNSPYFILQKEKLQRNLDKFKSLSIYTAVRFLYTLKGFDHKEGLPQIANSLSGFSIGNLNELAKIAEYKDKYIHTYSPAYYASEVLPLAKASTTMSFNSLTQWERYHKICSSQTSIGLRINPKIPLNQPSYCDSSNNKFGVAYSKFILLYQRDRELFKDLEGLHFHIFCHQDISALLSLLEHIDNRYRDILPSLKWLNLGGGQDFTSEKYDSQEFVKAIHKLKGKYPHITIYFEPCSSVVSDIGEFYATVLDIIEDSPSIAILNTSIETHLLDIAITKKRLKIKNASHYKTPYKYQLSGMSCIAGDTIGTYYFDAPLIIGETIIFEDMIGYTVVKQTTFNGIDNAKLISVSSG
ncbi:MAG: hypothetical protein QM493_02035 [Sulfurovum sp.]